MGVPLTANVRGDEVGRIGSDATIEWRDAWLRHRYRVQHKGAISTVELRRVDAESGWASDRVAYLDPSEALDERRHLGCIRRQKAVTLALCRRT